MSIKSSRVLFNIRHLYFAGYLLSRCGTCHFFFRHFFSTSRSYTRINREMITDVSIKISHPATFINFTSAVSVHVNYLSRFAFNVTMMYRRPHKKCERGPRRVGRYREKRDFRDCSMYGRTNSSMDQVLMTGTAERRRRYRAIDKPLRGSVAKMNRHRYLRTHNIKSSAIESATPLSR